MYDEMVGVDVGGTDFRRLLSPVLQIWCKLSGRDSDYLLNRLIGFYIT